MRLIRSERIHIRSAWSALGEQATFVVNLVQINFFCNIISWLLLLNAPAHSLVFDLD